MSIGKFARVTGLSIGALRHYAERGLLRPALVDDTTGYRYYGVDQVETAQLIATLRDLDVPIVAIASVVAGSAEDRDRALAAHLARTEAAAWRLQRLAHRLRDLMHSHHDLITEREKIMPSATPTLEPADERRLAATLFNRVWDLLETTDRTVADDDEMVHAAHASRYHWGNVGTSLNLARGEWQCARVYAVLRRVEPALHHANRCLEITTDNDLGPFEVGMSHEALARAYRVAGDSEQVARHVALGEAASARIEDPEDRKILDDDLADLQSPA